MWDCYQGEVAEQTVMTVCHGEGLGGDHWFEGSLFIEAHTKE